MERDLISDPSKFSSKTVGGYFTTRSFVAILFGGACIIPVVVLAIRGVIEPELASFLAFLISLPFGFMGAFKLHGMFPEKLLPIMSREYRSPREMTWQNPIVIEPVKKAKKISRQERKLAKKERIEAVGYDALLASQFENTDQG